MVALVSILSARPQWLGEPVLGGLLRVGDGGLLAAAAVLAHPSLYDRAEVSFWTEFYWPELFLVLLGQLLLMLLFTAAELYAPSRLQHRPRRRFLVAYGLTAAGVVGLALLVSVEYPVSRLWLGLWLLLGAGFVFAGRASMAAVLRWWSRTGRMVRNTVIVGDYGVARGLAEKMAAAGDPTVRLLGVFHDGQPDREPADGGSPPFPTCGTREDFLAFVRSAAVDEVVVALPWHADERLADWLGVLRNVPAEVLVCPPVGTTRAPDAADGVAVLAGRPLLRIAARPLDGWSYVIKLAEDRVLAALLVAALAPLMLLIAIAVRLDSPGPVLFRQKRNGFNNKVIEVLKFRTMTAATCQVGDGAFDQARRNDPRITRVGRFLRRTSLDELPQLFNVLGGSMSLIGPRPHAVAHNAQFERVINAYLGRHRVKPGITGWAQVNGHRGETDTREKMELRVQHDLYYIENWSLALDLEILVRTLGVLVSCRNAY